MKGTVYFVLSQNLQSTPMTDGKTDRQKGLANTVSCITCSRTVKLYNEQLVNTE